ncbi:MAG: glutamyl-tRNA reductase [Dongiaceae bacterium]
MAEPPGSPKEFLVAGVNHRSGTAALRERLFLDEAGQIELLAQLRPAGLDQAIVLSTCDRSEVCGISSEPSRTCGQVLQLVARQGRVELPDLLEQSYRKTGEPALRQLFAVASALDSAIVGEPFVLGQLKDSHRLSAAAGMIGPELEAILAAAYGAAKRVRNETTIAERPISIAAVAVQMARRVHGDLNRCAALLLGGGEMGEMMIEQLRQAGLSTVTVSHPSLRRGELVAHRLAGHVKAIEELPAALAGADIVVTAIGGSRELIDRPLIMAALKARRQRPMLLIDSSVPGDIDRDVGRIDGAYLFDLADLERLATEGRSARNAATEAAWAIIGAEVTAFQRARSGRQAAPSAVALRQHFEAIRAEVLRETASADAESATRLLINRLLHSPSTVLRELAANAAVDGDGELVAIERGLNRLFGLTEAPDTKRAAASDSKEKDA